MKCNECPRKCNIDRDEAVGFCGVGNKVRLARAALHMWEEPIISGKEGSGTIFFSGCNLKCVFCQNYDIAHGFGKDIEIDRLCEIMAELEAKGANNINLVTPSHYVDQIIKALDKYRPKVPIVYNSSGYESVDTLKKLEGYIDVYLPDLKYSDNALALKYSKCKDYFDIATKAILEMKRQQPKDVVVDGLMKKGIIVRHLVLPNGINNTLGVLGWIVDNMPKESYISLMGQFTPFGEAKDYPELNRIIKPLEYKLAINKLVENGFENAFIQDIGSASESFIPPFNLEGV